MEKLNVQTGILLPLYKLQELFPNTYRYVLDIAQSAPVLINVGSSTGTLTISVDSQLPFTVGLYKEGAPFARGEDLGEYSKLEIVMRDGSKFTGNSNEDDLIFASFSQRLNELA